MAKAKAKPAKKKAPAKSKAKPKPAKKQPAPKQQELEHFYYWASGVTTDDCCFLGIRCEAGGDGPPASGESWLLAARGGKVELVHGTDRPLIATYRAPTGELFAVDDLGNATRFDGTTSPAHPLGAKAMGMWGLDAKFVLAWGFTKEGAYPVFRWDGKAWSTMGATDFLAVRIHGSSRDDLWAVGLDGHTAQWNGKAWERVEAPVEEKLSGLWCASPTERYAVGKEGVLLAGDADGWRELGSWDYAFQAVAKWKGSVWVCAGAEGLLRLDGEELEPVRDMLAYDLDARGDLLVLDAGAIHGTTDGKKFTTIGKGALEKLRGSTPLRKF